MLEGCRGALRRTCRVFGARSAPIAKNWAMARTREIFRLLSGNARNLGPVSNARIFWALQIHTTHPWAGGGGVGLYKPHRAYVDPVVRWWERWEGRNLKIEVFTDHAGVQ